MKMMLRILVVDENPITRKHAVTIARGLHCTVTSVTSPEAAFAACAEHRFEAILVSNGLPTMAASEFVELALARGIHVPIIVMAVTPRTAVDAIRAGARGCIRKPVDVPGLVSTLPRPGRQTGVPRQRHLRRGNTRPAVIL